MANSAQSRKRVRQNNKKRLLNASQKSTTRSAVKAFRSKVAQANKSKQTIEKSWIASPQSALAMAVSKKLMHKKTASRLLKRLNALAKSAV